MKPIRSQNFMNWMGCFLIALAFLLLIHPKTLIIYGVQLVAIAMVVYAVYWFIQRWNNHTKNRVFDKTLKTYLFPMSMIFAASLLIFWRDYSPLVLAMIIGMYQLIVGLIGTYSYYLLVRDGVYNHWIQLINPLIHLMFGLWTFFASDRIEDTIFRLAIYLGLLGCNYIFDGWLQGSKHLISYQKRRIRIPMPAIFTLLFPYQMLMKVNKMLNQDEDTVIERLNPDSEEKSDAGLEVFIHISPFGFDRIGHTDIVYKNQVYTFGNFDAETRRLFGTVGDGVMFTTDRESYLKFLMRRQVTVMSFGVSLTDCEARDLEKALTKLMTTTKPFEMSTDRQKQGYVGALIDLANPQFYKFKRGLFQTYFVLGTNCVTFVDDLIWKSGVDIFAFAGIMTPGAYLDYFNKAYFSYTSKVVRRRIYHRRLMQKLNERQDKGSL